MGIRGAGGGAAVVVQFDRVVGDVPRRSRTHLLLPSPVAGSMSAVLTSESSMIEGDLP